MMEWFMKLNDSNKIAIVIPLAVVVLGGSFGLIKWLFSKKNASSATVNEIDQPGGDALNQLVRVSKEAGQSENEVVHLRQTVKQLEEQLASPQLAAGTTDKSQVPQPTQEAKEIAAHIQDDDGPYAQALKAIAEGDNEQANEFLDETQQFLDAVQEKKDRAQTKIYLARMQNATYAGKPQDALQYCDKLTNLAGDNALIMNEIAQVYHNNAQYQKAEPLMKRALTIDEASLGKDHPNVAIRLNNLATLYQDTNRLTEAELLMKRAITIDEASFGRDHPKVAIRLNNLATLYQATNRLTEAEPMMKRVVEILENPGGKPLPNYSASLNNLAMLYKATNRLTEAEPLMKRHLEIFIDFTRQTGHQHPYLMGAANNYTVLLVKMGDSKDQARAKVIAMAPDVFGQ